MADTIKGSSDGGTAGKARVVEMMCNTRYHIQAAAGRSDSNLHSRCRNVIQRTKSRAHVAMVIGVEGTELLGTSNELMNCACRSLECASLVQ